LIDVSRCVPSYRRKKDRGAERLRQLRVEVVTEDLREIADVESGR